MCFLPHPHRKHIASVWCLSVSPLSVQSSDCQTLVFMVEKTQRVASVLYGPAV